MLNYQIMGASRDTWHSLIPGYGLIVNRVMALLKASQTMLIDAIGGLEFYLNQLHEVNPELTLEDFDADWLIHIGM